MKQFCAKQVAAESVALRNLRIRVGHSNILTTFTQLLASDEIHSPLFAATVNTRVNFCLWEGRASSDEIYSPLFAAIEGIGTIRLALPTHVLTVYSAKFLLLWFGQAYSLAY